MLKLPQVQLEVMEISGSYLEAALGPQGCGGRVAQLVQVAVQAPHEDSPPRGSRHAAHGHPCSQQAQSQGFNKIRFNRSNECWESKGKRVEIEREGLRHDHGLTCTLGARSWHGCTLPSTCLHLGSKGS